LKNRSRTEIITAILYSAENGTGKTKIMYEAYLSYDQLKLYLAFLKRNGMITVNDKVIMTSAKGKSFLKASAQMDKLLR
jgi:predicted transcriptional regulator